MSETTMRSCLLNGKTLLIANFSFVTLVTLLPTHVTVRQCDNRGLVRKPYVEQIITASF